MDVNEHSTAQWDSSASEEYCEARNLSNKAAGNLWESIEPASSAPNEGGWDFEPAIKRSKSTIEENQMSKDLNVKEKPIGPVLGEPALQSREVEVPDSAIAHIIGHAHRTINALRNVPGITHVTTCMIKDTGENHRDLMQRVKVEGSSIEAITRVILQIKRIVLRSVSFINREVSVVCLPKKNKDGDAISLTLATAEECQHYLSKHLKPFVTQHAPNDAHEKKYFSCNRRVSSEQLTGNAKLVTLKRRKSYSRDGSSYLFESWESNLYTAPVSSCLRKFYKDSDVSLRGRPPQMKMRIQFGRTFLFGSGLKAPETWNVSLAELDTMTSEQTLRPCFSSYCQVDAVVKARKVLQAFGYKQHKAGSSQDTVCADLVDMDAPTKPSFNIRFMKRDKIAAKINRKARRHVYVTFVDGMQGHDLQLRIQSRQEEPVLDERTRSSVFEAWTKRAGIEDPLISPSGHHYFPLRVLRKVFEYYKKGDHETEVVLTEVSPVLEEPKDESTEISSRWKISIQQSWILPQIQNVDDDVENTVVRLTELLAEAKRFSEAIASEAG